MAGLSYTILLHLMWYWAPVTSATGNLILKVQESVEFLHEHETGTRKIRIRVQAELINKRYAINVYFDDISLTKPSLLAVRVISFTWAGADAIVHLKWDIESETNIDRYVLERSHHTLVIRRLLVSAVAGTFMNLRITSTE